MKKYIIAFPSSAFSPSIKQKLLSLNHFELYPNVFFLKTEIKDANGVYSFFQVSEGSNEKMVVFDITDTSYFGFAIKDLWTWLTA